MFRSAPEIEKRIHSKLFRKFWRSRGTKEPAYITVNLPKVEEGERRRVEEEIKSQEAEERHQKLVNEFRKLGEEHAALQVGRKGFSSRIWQITSMKGHFSFKTREMESREGRSVLEGRLEVALKEAEQVNFKTSNHIQSLFVVNIRNQCTAINAKMINIRRLFGILTSKDLAANRNHKHKSFYAVNFDLPLCFAPKYLLCKYLWCSTTEQISGSPSSPQNAIFVGFWQLSS